MHTSNKIKTPKKQK